MIVVRVVSLRAVKFIQTLFKAFLTGMVMKEMTIYKGISCERHLVLASFACLVDKFLTRNTHLLKFNLQQYQLGYQYKAVEVLRYLLFVSTKITKAQRYIGFMCAPRVHFFTLQNSSNKTSPNSKTTSTNFALILKQDDRNVNEKILPMRYLLIRNLKVYLSYIILTTLAHQFYTGRR